jgi:hypothetical protein
MVLVTRDFDFSDIRNHPPQGTTRHRVLQLPDERGAGAVVRASSRFFPSGELVERLPGRLAIVEGWRVRFRHGEESACPPPTQPKIRFSRLKSRFLSGPFAQPAAPRPGARACQARDDLDGNRSGRWPGDEVMRAQRVAGR